MPPENLAIPGRFVPGLGMANYLRPRWPDLGQVYRYKGTAHIAVEISFKDGGDDVPNSVESWDGDPG